MRASHHITAQLKLVRGPVVDDVIYVCTILYICICLCVVCMTRYMYMYNKYFGIIMLENFAFAG